MGNKITKPSPPSYSRSLDGDADHAALYERLFAVEARLKEQSGELENTKAELSRTREDHDKLVASVERLDENVGTALGSDLTERLSEYDELIYGRGIVTRDNLVFNSSYGDTGFVRVPNGLPGDSLCAPYEHYATSTLLLLLHNDTVKVATFGEENANSGAFPGAVPGFFPLLATLLSRNTTLEELTVFGGSLPMVVATSLETCHLRILILRNCTIEDDVATALSEAVQGNLGIRAMDLSKCTLSLIGRAALSIPRVIIPSA
ncbi:hypothetical protein HKX48_003008 [Thoreauomyces humboldtii]|nr:hypothetical protein HKX48_003008 [Thoreauomyces humboldtii]